jgi:hypothetical protein
MIAMIMELKIPYAPFLSEDFVSSVCHIKHTTQPVSKLQKLYKFHCSAPLLLQPLLKISKCSFDAVDRLETVLL